MHCLEDSCKKFIDIQDSCKDYIDLQESCKSTFWQNLLGSCNRCIFSQLGMVKLDSWHVVKYLKSLIEELLSEDENDSMKF